MAKMATADIYQRFHHLPPPPPPTFLSRDASSARARLPNFTNPRQVHDFLASIVHWHYPLWARRFCLGVSVILLLYLVAFLVLIAIRCRRRSWRLFRTERRENGLLIMPHAHNGLLLCVAIYLALVSTFLILCYLHRGTHVTHKIIWITGLFMPLALGFWWQFCGIVAASIPRKLDDQHRPSRSRLRSGLMAMIPPWLLNTAIIFGPLFGFATVMAPAVLSNRAYMQVRQELYPAFELRYANQTVLSRDMLVDAQQIWYNMLRMAFLLSITLLGWVILGGLISLLYVGFVWHTTISLRHYLDQLESTLKGQAEKPAAAQELVVRDKECEQKQHKHRANLSSVSSAATLRSESEPSSYSGGHYRPNASFDKAAGLPTSSSSPPSISFSHDGKMSTRSFATTTTTSSCLFSALWRAKRLRSSSASSSSGALSSSTTTSLPPAESFLPTRSSRFSSSIRRDSAATAVAAPGAGGEEGVRASSASDSAATAVGSSARENNGAVGGSDVGRSTRVVLSHYITLCTLVCISGSSLVALAAYGVVSYYPAMEAGPDAERVLMVAFTNACCTSLLAGALLVSTAHLTFEWTFAAIVSSHSPPPSEEEEEEGQGGTVAAPCPAAPDVALDAARRGTGSGGVAVATKRWLWRWRDKGRRSSFDDSVKLAAEREDEAAVLDEDVDVQFEMVAPLSQRRTIADGAATAGGLSDRELRWASLSHFQDFRRADDDHPSGRLEPLSDGSTSMMTWPLWLSKGSSSSSLRRYGDASINGTETTGGGGFDASPLPPPASASSRSSKRRPQTAGGHETSARVSTGGGGHRPSTAGGGGAAAAAARMSTLPLPLRPDTSLILQSLRAGAGADGSSEGPWVGGSSCLVAELAGPAAAAAAA